MQDKPFANQQDGPSRRPPPPPPPLRPPSNRDREMDGAASEPLASQEKMGEGQRTEEESRRLGFFLELFLTPTTLGLTSGIGPLMAGVTSIAIVVGIAGFLVGSISMVLSRGMTIYLTAPLFLIKWLFDLNMTWTHRPSSAPPGWRERTQKIAVLVYLALAVVLIAGESGIFYHDFREKKRIESERRFAAEKEAERLAKVKQEREEAIRVEAARKQEEQLEKEMERAQEVKRLRLEKERSEQQEKREWEKKRLAAAEALKEKQEQDEVDRKKYEADLATLGKEQEELAKKLASLEADFKKSMTQIKKVAPAMEAAVRRRMVDTKGKYDETQARLDEIDGRMKRLKEKIREIKDRQ